MKKIIILGAGGHGLEVAFLIEAINRKTPSWELLGFLDDAHAQLLPQWGRYPVLGGLTDIPVQPQDVCFALANDNQLD